MERKVWKMRGPVEIIGDMTCYTHLSRVYSVGRLSKL